MFEAIKRLLSGASEQDQAEALFGDNNARVAVAALLVHAISIDGTVDDSEQRKMRETLSSAYQLADSEAEALIEHARRRDDEAVDLHGFTSVIKSRFDAAQRRQVVEMLWEMVYADGELHELEDNMVWRVAELLGISTRERVVLRMRVEARRREAGEVG